MTKILNKSDFQKIFLSIEFGNRNFIRGIKMTEAFLETDLKREYIGKDNYLIVSTGHYYDYIGSLKNQTQIRYELEQNYSCVKELYNKQHSNKHSDSSE
jgi:hypothetical protein